MFSKTAKQTGIAIVAATTLLIGGVGVIAAKAAPIHLNQIQISESAINEDLVQVRGFGKHRGHKFRGHSRSFKRGHQFKRGHKFNRGHGFRTNRYSRHGSFTRNGFHSRNDFTKRQIPGFVLTPKSR